MTKYADRDYWEDSILMPDKSTPVLGGTPVWDGDLMLEGFSNISAAQLADRTRNLKNKLEQVASVIKGDGFLRVADNLADLADIEQAKFNLALNNVDNTPDAVKNVLSAKKLEVARTISTTGDVTYTSGAFDGTANVTGTATLAPSGVVAGTYPKVTVDAKGRATSGTTLVAGDIPNLDAGKITSGTLADARLSGTYTGVSITGSAATLGTARTINGTSFNGSANITTDNWGTARNITIGSTAKSVNGSANVSWTLAEIRALGVDATASKAEVLATSSTTKFVSPNSYGNLISWHDNGAISTGTLTLNLNTSLNHKVSVGGNITVATPSNATLGKTGDIVLTLTANATVSWATTWRFLGSVPNIGNSGSMWVVSYKVLSGTQVLASAAKVA